VVDRPQRLVRIVNQEVEIAADVIPVHARLL
jgi:hypothetical protein